MSDPFNRYDLADVRDLIEEYPLAWVCAADANPDHASLLPLIVECDDAGAVTQLIGHMARRNPLFAALSARPEVRILFRGPDAYVSPENAQKRAWGPTWNYAQVRVEANLIFEPDQTGAALNRLVDAMEAGRPQPWHAVEMGERYTPMVGAIVGFRASVTRVSAKFKLGQDEQPDTLRAILSSLRDPAMVRWMRRFNKERL